MLLNVLGREVPQTKASQRKSYYQQWIVRTGVNKTHGEEITTMLRWDAFLWVSLAFCTFCKNEGRVLGNGRKKLLSPLQKFRASTVLEKSYKTASAHQIISLLEQVLLLLKNPTDWLESLQENPNTLMTASKCSKWENPLYWLKTQILPFPIHF